MRRAVVLLLIAVLASLVGVSPAFAQAGPMVEPGEKGLWDRVRGTVTNDCQAEPPDIQEPKAPLAAPFTELAQDFEAAHPGTSVELSLGPSSALAGQVASGAPADVFAAASTDTMDAAVAAGAAQGAAYDAERAWRFALERLLAALDDLVAAAAQRR